MNFVGPFFAGVFFTLLVIFLFNVRQDPLVKQAKKVAKGLKAMQFLASKLPEGSLLNILDWEIREQGESASMEGQPTSEINRMMLDLLHNKYLGMLTQSIVSSHKTTIKISTGN